MELNPGERNSFCKLATSNFVLDKNKDELVLLRCPLCLERLEPNLLGFFHDPDDGHIYERVWWTCRGLRTKSCCFPLQMPADVFWCQRTLDQMQFDVLPLPRIDRLSSKYLHRFYPHFLSASDVDKLDPIVLEQICAHELGDRARVRAFEERLRAKIKLNGSHLIRHAEPTLSEPQKKASTSKAIPAVADHISSIFEINVSKKFEALLQQYRRDEEFANNIAILLDSPPDSVQTVHSLLFQPDFEQPASKQQRLPDESVFGIERSDVSMIGGVNFGEFSGGATRNEEREHEDITKKPDEDISHVDSGTHRSGTPRSESAFRVPTPDHYDPVRDEHEFLTHIDFMLKQSQKSQIPRPQQSNLSISTDRFQTVSHSLPFFRPSSGSAFNAYQRNLVGRDGDTVSAMDFDQGTQPSVSTEKPKKSFVIDADEDGDEQPMDVRGKVEEWRNNLPDKSLLHDFAEVGCVEEDKTALIARQKSPTSSHLSRASNRSRAGSAASSSHHGRVSAAASTKSLGDQSLKEFMQKHQKILKMGAKISDVFSVVSDPHRSTSSSMPTACHCSNQQKVFTFIPGSSNIVPVSLQSGQQQQIFIVIPPISLARSSNAAVSPKSNKPASQPHKAAKEASAKRSTTPLLDAVTCDENTSLSKSTKSRARTAQKRPAPRKPSKATTPRKKQMIDETASSDNKSSGASSTARNNTRSANRKRTAKTALSTSSLSNMGFEEEEPEENDEPKIAITSVKRARGKNKKSTANTSGDAIAPQTSANTDAQGSQRKSRYISKKKRPKKAPIQAKNESKELEPTAESAPQIQADVAATEIRLEETTKNAEEKDFVEPEATVEVDFQGNENVEVPIEETKETTEMAIPQDVENVEDNTNEAHSSSSSSFDIRPSSSEIDRLCSNIERQTLRAQITIGIVDDVEKQLNAKGKEAPNADRICRQSSQTEFAKSRSKCGQMKQMEATMDAIDVNPWQSVEKLYNYEQQTSETKAKLGMRSFEPKQIDLDRLKSQLFPDRKLMRDIEQRLGLKSGTLTQLRKQKQQKLPEPCLALPSQPSSVSVSPLPLRSISTGPNLLEKVERSNVSQPSTSARSIASALSNTVRSSASAAADPHPVPSPGPFGDKFHELNQLFQSNLRKAKQEIAEKLRPSAVETAPNSAATTALSPSTAGDTSSMSIFPTTTGYSAGRPLTTFGGTHFNLTTISLGDEECFGDAMIIANNDVEEDDGPMMPSLEQLEQTHQSPIKTNFVDNVVEDERIREDVLTPLHTFHPLDGFTPTTYDEMGGYFDSVYGTASFGFDNDEYSNFSNQLQQPHPSSSSAQQQQNAMFDQQNVSLGMDDFSADEFMMTL